MMKRILRYILVVVLSLGLGIIGFYFYAAYEFSSAVKEGTTGVIEFISKEKNKKVTVYDKDSISAMLDSFGLSFILDGLQEKDTFHIKIYKRNED